MMKEIWSNLCFYGRCIKIVCQEWWRKIFVVAITLSACGCLSVVRIPFPIHEKYSDDGVCTNRVWEGFLDKFPEYRVYTTVKMRCHITHEMLKPIPEDLKGEKLYNARMTKRWGWLPLTFIWLTAPFDAAVDTIFLPYDLYSRKEQS